MLLSSRSQTDFFRGKSTGSDGGARFGSSSVTGEELRLTVRIEDFSTRLCKETFESPEFGLGSCPDAKFSLIVELTDVDYVAVRLSRNPCDWDEYGHHQQQQLVKASVSVVDFAGCPSLTEVANIYFDKGYADSREVLAVGKGQLLSRYFGLNKLRFLPDDTLTLVCDLVVYREISESFESREAFERRRGTPGISGTVQYFARSRLASEEFDFVRRFCNFSVRSCKERLVSDGYRHGDSEWSIVVYDCQDVLDIKLRRNNTMDEGQFVKVKLALVGRLGALFSHRGCKEAYFHGYRDEETLVLSVSKRRLSGWCGMKNLLMMPDDSLTVQCRVTAYEENVTTFDRQKDFANSFDHGDGHWWRWVISSWMTVYFLLSLLFVGTLTAAHYVVTSWICPFLIDYVLPLVINVLWLAAIGVLIYVGVLGKMWWNERQAEKRKKEWEERQNRRRNNPSRHTGKEVAVYQKGWKQNAVPYPKRNKKAYCFYDRKRNNYLYYMEN